MQIRKHLKLREVFLSLSLFFLASNLLFANSLPNFTSIVDKNIDAVVIVNAKKNINDSTSLQPNLPEEFKPFFDRFFENVSKTMCCSILFGVVGFLLGVAGHYQFPTKSARTPTAKSCLENKS